MWLILAFCSAALLGFYDVCKKKALLDNAVLPVLFLNTVICSLIFIPFIVLSLGTNVLDGTAFYVEPSTWAEHKYIILKACFSHNRWIFFLVAAAILGAVSGLYDKYLMAPPANGGVGLSRMVVQSWYNIYQLCLMGVTMFAIWYPTRKKTTPFKWRWSIILISVFLSIADFVYFYALSLPGAMISIVSMVRRGSVVVSFFCGAMLFKEKNLTSKLVDMLFVILGMLFLYIGSH